MKVLHIGNIANNAYLNAKILNQYGIESHVLSKDYFHIMGCPEWEDSDFIGDYGDDNTPNWSKLDLQGFKTPIWFAKGNETLCINYLLSLSSKDIAKEKAYKNILNKINLLFQKSKYYFVNIIKKILIRLIYKSISFFNKLISIYYRYFTKYSLLIKILIFPIYLTYKYRFKIINGMKIYKKNNLKENDVGKFDKIILDRISFLKQSIINDFPQRANLFNLTSINIYADITRKYIELFENYDIVIGYGVDGIYPLLAGKKYIAFEHGTIRNLPFQNDDLGLRTLLSYKYADGVIVTNADNIEAAKKLELKNYKFIPHPINEEPLKLLDNMDYQNLYKKYDTDFIAFHPSRQHWEKEIRHPDWEKGNDIFIEGFAKFVKEVNPKAKSIFIEWGQKVSESKELIKNLDIEENIVWIKPLHNYAMIRTILSSDVVADQFYLGAFGSTTPKALMCGKPAMLYLNESLHEWCFDEMPPVLNTASSEDVFDELAKLYADINFAKKLSFDSKNWYMKYHSNKLIKDRLVKMIDNILKNKNEDL